MQNIANGGVQYVPQIAVQYVYLDFDGELTSYNGEILTVENVVVKDSSLTKERIAHIVAELNAKYASQNVIFVTDRPTTAEYSTIFIGKTDAFSSYGNFAGLAETIDEGNKNSTDNAFVMLDSTNSNEAIIFTISHETDHLLGTLDHGGSGLSAYAADVIIGAGTTSTGLSITSGNRVIVSSGGVANSTTVYSGGDMDIFSGGVANSTTVNSYGWMYIFSGGVANSTTVNSDGSMTIDIGGTATAIKENGGYVNVVDGADVTFVSNTITGLTLNTGMTVHKNTVANSTTVNSYGWMHISSGGVANNTTVNSRGYMYISSGGTATAIKENGGYVNVANGANVTFVSNTISGLTLNTSMTVHKNTVANSTTVKSGGSMYISSGGVANNTTLDYGGMYISSGGVANSTTVNGYGGAMSISSGGVANSTTVNSLGAMSISSGGVANSTTVNSGGDMTISSGGVANSTTVNSGGNMTISSGGTATNIVWTPFDGNIYVSKGAYVTYATPGYGVYFGSNNKLLSHTQAMTEEVASACSMYVLSGGVANSTTVNSGGDMYIIGGVANSTTVSYGGEMYIYSGCTANSTTVAGGDMYIIGGVANSTTVNSWGSMYISSGGVANNTTVNASGYMYISSGGVASSTTVNSGYMYIFSGGSVNNTTINSGGYMYISSGGEANSTTINSSGNMHIFSGGTANNTTINSGCYMYISSDGEANSTTINSSGYMYISSGGVASSITVNSGNMHVFSGGTANNTTINSGGCMYISSGGEANSTTINSSGDMRIYGVVNNATVNEHGYIRICNGGVANSATVNSEGWIYIESAGVVENLTLKTGGWLGGFSFAEDKYFSQISGAVKISSNVSIINSRMSVSSGGVASRTTVNSGGKMYVSSGGTATLIKENGGYVYVAYGAKVTFVSNTISRLSVTHTSMSVHSSTVAHSTIVNSGGCIDIFSGGVANSTIVNYGGRMHISSGGTASIIYNPWQGTVSAYVGAKITYHKDARIYYGGYENGLISRGSYFSGLNIVGGNSAIISSGGVASSTTVNSGNMHIFSGGTANNTTINSGGEMYNSGVANDTTVNSSGNMHIYGVVNNAAVNEHGYIRIYNGGVANNTTVNSRGRMTIVSGGTATAIKENGGYVDVADGADVTFVSNTITGLTLNTGMTVHKNTVANSTTVNPGGSMLISCGGVANDATVNGYYDAYATVTIFSGGIANNTTVDHCGSMSISSCGVANSTTVNSGGYMSISSGGVANNTTVNGEFYFSSGEMFIRGVANDTTVNSGGKMYIFSDGVANATTIKSGGEMYISSGGSHRGTMNLAQGAVVSAYSESTIDFTVAGRKASDDYLINDLSLISGSPIYTISVDSDQDLGIYKLAKGAENFTGTITVSDSSGIYGSITVNGEDLLYNGIVYSLDQADGNLTLEIMDITPPDAPVASANITSVTNKDVIVTVTYSDDSTIKQYKIGNGEWQNYIGAFSVSENGTIYFRAEDAAGNESTSELVISNIDNVAPDKPVAAADITSATNGNVRVSATFSSDTVIKEYSLDKKEWKTYTSGIVFEQNGVIYFRGTDEAVNISEITEYKISNIDKVAPAKPVVTANTANPTNNDVTVTVIFSEDSTVKQYRIGDGEWQDYIEVFTVSENGAIYFRAEDATENESTNELVISNIDKAAPSIPYGFNKTISGYSAKLDWADAIDSGVAGVKGYNICYGVSEALTGDGEFVAVSEFDLTDLAVGTYYYQVRTEDKAGNISEWSAIQSFEILPGAVQNLHGDCSGLSWDVIPGVESYIVEYSTDNFAHVISFETIGNQVDSIALPAGTYQWRVKAVDGEIVSNGENIIYQEIVTEPQEFISNADGNMDLFFAEADGTWEVGYAAEHQGILNGWLGTEEQVKLTEKNKIADVFNGSSDANILVLTDDSNGDALFFDDVYTAWGDQGRLKLIDEIRAGAGADIVDLTSQKFAYAEEGVKVYGGVGNDTIWANKGKNILFGDAGNDRIVGGSGDDVIIGGIGNDSMHGGGGEDIFTFGGNWGKDTITQLTEGKVTLWFEDGDKSNWNSSTLTYTDGTNSVKVTGIASDKISLKFGGDTSDLPDGAFAEAASEKIFEDKNKGMLA